jgi:DNA invertase Pin-like site-specific DNA recombinase
MKVGYARTSTIEQVAGLEAQVRELTAMGCEKIFQENGSGVDMQRPQLEAAITFIREGDELIVTKLDRLARSVADLLEIVQRVKAKKVILNIGNLGRINGDPTGDLLLTVLGAIAQFERELMLERQREGIAKAKSEGKYKGRAPTARRQAAEVLELVAQGVGKAEIARRLGMHRASVFRILKSEQESPEHES